MNAIFTLVVICIHVYLHIDVTVRCISNLETLDLNTEISSELSHMYNYTNIIVAKLCLRLSILGCQWKHICWQNDNAKSVALISSTAHGSNVLAAMYVYK